MQTSMIEAAPKICANCRHCGVGVRYGRGRDVFRCLEPSAEIPGPNLVTGMIEFRTCAEMRQQKGRCGPSGRLYAEHARPLIDRLEASRMVLGAVASRARAGATSAFSGTREAVGRLRNLRVVMSERPEPVLPPPLQPTPEAKEPKPEDTAPIEPPKDDPPGSPEPSPTVQRAVLERDGADAMHKTGLAVACLLLGFLAGGLSSSPSVLARGERCSVCEKGRDGKPTNCRPCVPEGPRREV